MSNLGSRSREVVAYERLRPYWVKNVPFLAYDNCFKCVIRVKSQFRGKSGTSQREISVSGSTQYDDLSTPYYPISVLLLICQVVAHESLRAKENFRRLALKVIGVAY